jgi:hypothetical protein
MDGHVRKVPYRPESKTGEVRYSDRLLLMGPLVIDGSP